MIIQELVSYTDLYPKSLQPSARQPSGVLLFPSRLIPFSVSASYMCNGLGSREINHVAQDLKMDTESTLDMKSRFN